MYCFYHNFTLWNYDMNKLYDNGVAGWLCAICDKTIHSWFRAIDLYSNNSDHNIKWNDRNYKIYDSNDNDIYGYLKHYTINTNTDPDLIQIHNGIIKLNCCGIQIGMMIQMNLMERCVSLNPGYFNTQSS